MDPQIIAQAIIALIIGIPIMIWTEWEAHQDKKLRRKQDEENLEDQ